MRPALGGLAVAGVLIGALAYLMHFALVAPPRPHFAAPGDQAEANRQDLAYAHDALHAMDRSFSHDEWRRFDRQIDELEQRAGQLDPAALEMQLAKAAGIRRSRACCDSSTR